MSHSKIAKLVAEVSKELQIDIPDVDRMTIMQEVRNLVKTNHPVPELMNSESETEQETEESDIEFVGVTETNDEESSVSDVIEIMSNEKSTDSPLSVGNSVNDGTDEDEELENDRSDVVEMDSLDTQTNSDCEYEETVDDSPVLFADEQNGDDEDDNATMQRHNWRELRRKFSRKNPWVTRKRRKKKTGLIYSVLKKAKISSLKSFNKTAEIPSPIVVFKRTMDKKKPWDLQTISSESYMEQDKAVGSSLKKYDSMGRSDTKPVKKLSSVDAETIMNVGLGKEKQVPNVKDKTTVKKKTTSNIIRDSMKKYPGVILKDAKVRLKDCITDSERYKLLLNYIKEQQLKEAAAAAEVDVQAECKDGLFFKCGVALRDRSHYNWNRLHDCPEPIRIAPKISELELKVDKLASLSSSTVATEKEKLELEWIGTDPSKGFKDLLVHSDFASERDMTQISGSSENKGAEIDWNGESESTECYPDIKPNLGNLNVQTKSVTDSCESDVTTKERKDPVLDPITGEFRGQPVLDPVTGELTFEDSLDRVKEEPIDEVNTESEMKPKGSDTAIEIVNDITGSASTVNVEGAASDKNTFTLPSGSSQIVDTGFKLPGAELIYTCTTTEGVLPIEQIESAINKDIESRRSTEDTNWRQLKTTLAERVYRIEKLMGTISEENKDGEIDQFKHYALQKARAELESVKEQTGLIRGSQAAKPVHIMDSTDDEASSDSNFSVSNLITNDEDEVMKAEERGLKRKREDSHKSSKRKTNENTAGAVTVDFSMDNEFIELRESNPICPARKPVRDIKFLGKFDMLIRRELYKTMLAPNLSHDEFDNAMASMMGVPLETCVLEVIEEKMSNLKIKLRRCWMKLIQVKSFEKNNEDHVKKSRIQAKSLEYLRGRIYDSLKPCILKSYSYQAICRMILICLCEILEKDKKEINALYRQELEAIQKEEEIKKKRDLFSAQFEDIQAREAIRLRKINMQENELARQKKEAAERQAKLEEEKKRKAADTVVIDLVEEDGESNKKTSNPEPWKPIDSRNIKLVHDMLMNKMQSGAAKTLESTYSRGAHTARGGRPYRRRRRPRQINPAGTATVKGNTKLLPATTTYLLSSNLMNPAGGDMSSNVHTKPSPGMNINPPSTDLQKRCPLLFLKLQQHVKKSLERSTGDLLSDAVREGLAYRIASSYASEHQEELKSLEQMVQQQAISTEVQEGLDFIIQQNIDDDEEDDTQNSVSNIKQSSSPPLTPSGSQDPNHDQNAPASVVQSSTIKQELIECDATKTVTESAVSPPAVTNWIGAVPAQFVQSPSVEIAPPIRPTSLLDAQNAVKMALANRLATGLPKVRVPLPPGLPFLPTGIPEQTKAALADKLNRNQQPYQTSTTTQSTSDDSSATARYPIQSTSDDSSATVRYPRERCFPFATNARVSQPTVVVSAGTVFVSQSPQTQIATATSTLIQDAGSIVVDATVPSAAQEPLNIKHISKQNDQAAGQPIALQRAYVSGSMEQLLLPVFPSANSNSASQSSSPTMSEAPVLSKLQQLLTAPTSGTGAQKPNPGIYPATGKYERTSTPPPPDSSAPITSGQPSPFLQQIRPVALRCASPNLVQARPPSVASPSLPQVRPVGTPSPAATVQPVRPGTTPSPLTRQASPQNSQFCQLPIPSMQLADFLAMQLRAQIEAANKIAEGTPSKSLNLPFMKNNDEIMTALNAPILKAMDSPLLAALNSTVIKALEGSLGQQNSMATQQRDGETSLSAQKLVPAQPSEQSEGILGEPSLQVPTQMSTKLGEQSVSATIDSQSSSTSSESPSVQNPVPTELCEQSAPLAIDSQSPSTSSQSSTVSQPVTSHQLTPPHSGAPIISGKVLIPEEQSTSVESVMICSSSRNLTYVVSPVTTTSAAIVTTPSLESVATEASKDTPAEIENLSSNTSCQVSETAKDSATTEIPVGISANENKDIPDNEARSDTEEDYEVYTYAEPNNTNAFAKVLDFLGSTTADGDCSIDEEEIVGHSGESMESSVTETENIDDTRESIECNSDKGTTSCSVDNDDASRDSGPGVLEIAFEEPENESVNVSNDRKTDSKDSLKINPKDKALEPSDLIEKECVESDNKVNAVDASTEDTATASESEQTSVCTIVSYGSLAPSETVTDSKEQHKLIEMINVANQETTLRDLLSKPSVSKSPSVNPSLVNPLICKDVSTSSSVNANTKEISSTSIPTLFPPSLTKYVQSFLPTTPSLGDLLSKTATAVSSLPPKSTVTSSAKDSASVASDSSAFPPTHSFSEVRIPPGYLAAPLDGAFRVTLPDETINKIIEDAIKSVGTTLTPKAQAMVRSQLDRISVPKDFPDNLKPGIMRDAAQTVLQSTTDTASSGQSDVEIVDGNLASSGTRRRNDPFFKLPLSGVRPIRNVAEDGTVSWTCTVCGKSFTRNFTYRRHAETHMNIKPWKCDICSKAFTDKRYLSKHMRWHTGQDLQYCDECGRAFSDELALLKHKRVHNTSDKNYQCDKCEKVFTDSNTLKRHKLHVHEQRKNHKCELCNLMFVFKSHLDDHMKRHTGEKPHRCSICGRGFIQVGTRNRHERQHKEAGEPFKCSICMNIFWFKEELKNHFESMHPGIPIPEAHRDLLRENDGTAKHEDVSEEENRIRVSHIPRERYLITSGEEDSSDTGNVSGSAPVAVAANPGPPELTLAEDEDDFIPDALAANQQIPVLLNENEPIPEIEAKGNIKDLIAAVEPMLCDTSVNPVICNVETVTDPDTKEHLKELVRQQEEKDRLASEGFMTPSKEEQEKDKQASDHVVKLSKQQEQKDRLAREEIIRLSQLLYKNEAETKMKMLAKHKNIEPDSVIKIQDKNSTGNSSDCPIKVKTEPIDAELSDDAVSKKTESAKKESDAVKQQLNNLMKPQSAASSTNRTTDNAEQNTNQAQSVPNIKDISKGIRLKASESWWLQTKTKLEAKTDKIQSLMELFREKGVPKEENVSGGNESEDSD